MAHILGPCHPHGIAGWSSRLPPSAWPILGCFSQLGLESKNDFLSFPSSLSFPPFVSLLPSLPPPLFVTLPFKIDKNLSKHNKLFDENVWSETGGVMAWKVSAVMRLALYWQDFVWSGSVSVEIQGKEPVGTILQSVRILPIILKTEMFPVLRAQWRAFSFETQSEYKHTVDSVRRRLCGWMGSGCADRQNQLPKFPSRRDEAVVAMVAVAITAAFGLISLMSCRGGSFWNCFSVRAVFTVLDKQLAPEGESVCFVTAKVKLYLMLVAVVYKLGSPLIFLSFAFSRERNKITLFRSGVQPWHLGWQW